MDKLIEGIDNRCNLSDTEMTLLRQTLRILHFPKGSIVIGEGKTDDSSIFWTKVYGCLLYTSPSPRDCS